MVINQRLTNVIYLLLSHFLIIWLSFQKELIFKNQDIQVEIIEIQLFDFKFPL